MKNEVNDILNSDLLERYLLGDLSDREINKVQSLLESSPKIRERLNELELSLEKSAFENKSTIPDDLKQKIISKNYKTPTSTNKPFQKWIFHAAFFILGLALAWFFQQNKYSKIEKEKDKLEEQLAQLKIDCDRSQKQLAFLNDPNTLPVVLQGTAYAPTSEVYVYWNEKQKECLLRVAELPNIPDDKTYQLWADVKGKMISLGTFDHKEAKIGPIQMSYLSNAESLNITIEKMGGTDHPDVSTLSASMKI